MHCLNRADGKEAGNFPPAAKSKVPPSWPAAKSSLAPTTAASICSRWRTAKQLWSYEIGQAVDQLPRRRGEKIVIGADDGGVYCFGQKS